MTKYKRSKYTIINKLVGFFLVFFYTISIFPIDRNTIQSEYCISKKIEDIDIHTAAFMGCDIKLVALITGGTDINGYSKEGDTPLILAIQMEHMSTTMILIKHGSNPNLLSRDNYYSPLISAVNSQNLSLIDLLVQSGANINLQNKHGISPLFSAVTFDRLDIIKLLLDHGADFNPEQGIRPIVAAVSIEVFDFLVSKGADPWSRWPEGNLMIFNVAMQGSSELLQKLVALGMDVNSFNHKGYTSLMIAASFGKLDNIKVLIQAGANIMAENKEGKTALDLAKEEGHQAIVEYLESHMKKK